MPATPVDGNWHRSSTLRREVEGYLCATLSMACGRPSPATRTRIGRCFALGGIGEAGAAPPLDPAARGLNP